MIKYKPSFWYFLLPGLISSLCLSTIRLNAEDQLPPSHSPLKLWYKNPSGNVWENALPIGNGRLGAMVYGNVETETIQLNEHTLWSGGPNRNDNPEALESLPAIRKLIFDGKQKEAELLANKVIISKQSQGQMFEPAGELHLQFPGHERYSDYYRELDLDQAVTKTSYRVGGVRYTRTALASIPDRVIAIHLTADKPGMISFTVSFSSPQPQVKLLTSGTRLTFSGTTIDHEGVSGQIRYKGISEIKQMGGTRTSTDSSITFKHANSATIYISIATNFIDYKNINGDADKLAESYLAKAAGKSFDNIQKAHSSAYQKYFNRVKFDLGATQASKLPTDERLSEFRFGNDPQFAALYYQ